MWPLPIWWRPSVVQRDERREFSIKEVCRMTFRAGSTVVNSEGTTENSFAGLDDSRPIS